MGLCFPFSSQFGNQNNPYPISSVDLTPNLYMSPEVNKYKTTLTINSCEKDEMESL